jgi:amidase
MNLPSLPALELARMLRAREFSSEELVLACLERVDAHNARLCAMVDVLRERALAEARAADRRLGRRQDDLPPFLGVPIAIKDLNLARGSFTRFGSRAFEKLFSPFDDALVAQLRRGGFVILGKSATSELGTLPIVETAIHPPTRNPWDPDVTPGGSSGGAGAAVAGGMVPIAQGSDAAGSIRIPASFCGLFGIKPSQGRVPNPYGLDDTKLIWTSGPIARTVDDAAAMLDVMAGVPGGYARREDVSTSWAPLPPRPFAELARERPPRLRVRVALRCNIVETDGEIAAAVERVARLLEKQGHRIEERPMVLPDDAVEDFLPVWQSAAVKAPVYDWSVTQPVTRWLAERGRDLDPRTVEQLTEKLRRMAFEQFGDADVWITPTVAVPPPRVGAWTELEPPEVLAAAIHLGAFTAPFNISWQPAASLPAGLSRRGHPIGVQIAGRPLADALVLAVARALEAELAWPTSHGGPPPAARASD